MYINIYIYFRTMYVTLLSTPCIEVKVKVFFLGGTLGEKPKPSLLGTLALWVWAFGAWCCAGCLLWIVESALGRGLHNQHTFLYLCDDVWLVISSVANEKTDAMPLVHECCLWATNHSVWWSFACCSWNPPPPRRVWNNLSFYRHF